MSYDPTDGCSGCGTIDARHAPDCPNLTRHQAREHHIICIPADALTGQQRDALHELLASVAEQITGATSAIEITDDCHHHRQ